MNPAEKKDEIRREMKKKRLSAKADYLNKNSQRICENIESHPVFINSKKILFYYPHKNEVDLLPLLKKYIGKKNVYLPKTTKDLNLEICELKSFSDLVSGTFELKEPNDQCKKINPSEIELALIPGLAFDISGNRIGYGKGYYDKLLKQMQAFKIGLAYDFQILDNVPGQSWDEKMDIILS